MEVACLFGEDWCGCERESFVEYLEVFVCHFVCAEIVNAQVFAGFCCELWPKKWCSFSCFVAAGCVSFCLRFLCAVGFVGWVWMVWFCWSGRSLVAEGSGCVCVGPWSLVLGGTALGGTDVLCLVEFRV